MSLRVLLADESSTIKRVISLSLQDHSAEVHAVHLGIDVLDAARSFKPDIIFADVLLQKKNGYEVCAEIKKDPELNKIPVVLIWSGFMELDETKLRQANPDAKLEKPFDADTLRNLVNNLLARNNAASQQSTSKTITSADSDKKISADAVKDFTFQKSSKKDSLEDFFQNPGQSATTDDVTPRAEDQWEMLKLATVSTDEPDKLAIDEESLNDEQSEQTDISRFKIDLPDDKEISAVTFEYDLAELATDDNDDIFKEKPLNKALAADQQAAPVKIQPLEESVKIEPSEDSAQSTNPQSGGAIKENKQVPEVTENTSTTMIPATGQKSGMPPEQSMVASDSLQQQQEQIKQLQLQLQKQQDLLIKQQEQLAQQLNQQTAPQNQPQLFKSSTLPQPEFSQPVAQTPAENMQAKPNLQILNNAEIKSQTLTIDVDQKNEISQMVARDLILSLSADKLENLIEQQMQKSLQNLIQKIVPDIAEKMIKAELHRLLRDPDLDI